MMKVLIISSSLIPSVLLCGHSQMEYLKERGEVDYRFVDAPHVTNALLSWANTIVFVRSESEIEKYAARLAKKAGKHLVYVLDDDLLNAPRYLSSAPYYLRPDIQENFRDIMANCDTFLTPSRIMVEKYGKDFKHAFIIDEPSLDPIKEKTPNDKVRIGFAGSIDRAQDINEILSGALTAIIDKYGDKVMIEFMGARPEIVDKCGLSYVPYQDSYEKYEQKVKERNWDIGLAPMPDTPFHACKYFNKYVEYASFGIVGVYSNLSPYTYGIKDGYNGLLVENTTEAWTKAISKLVDEELYRRQLADNCIKEALSTYSIETLANDYFEKISVDYEESNVRIKGLWRYYLKVVVKKVIYKVKEQGLNLPVWAFNKILKKVRHE